ncbi:MAG: ATP-binding cassette domain-containing protein [Micrococcus sp.]|nr:ATP-binding cassette domain-containing protein [Micrococcus sp.]
MSLIEQTPTPARSATQTAQATGRTAHPAGTARATQPQRPGSGEPQPPAAVVIDSVTKTYGGNRVLDQVSFTVPAGQITGFVGPNGAGKSTLLRVVLGLTTPDSGTVSLHGAPTPARGSSFVHAARPAHEVGALLSAETLPAAMTARGYLTYVADTQGLPRTRVAEVLETVELAHAADRKIKTFSLGMRQRAGIAAALLAQPRLLILDEPLNGLDVDGIVAVRHLLRSLAASGVTVLVSSHLMNELAAVVDHVVMIRTGRLLAEGPLEALQAGGRTLEQAYLDHVHA